MKKYVSAASSSKPLTKDNYLTELKKAAQFVQADAYDLENVCPDILSKLELIVSTLKGLDLEYSFDKYNVDNPENYGWFDDVPDSQVDSYYDAYERFCKAAKDYDDFSEYIESLIDKLSDVVHMLQ